MAKSQQIETTVIDPQVNELPESNIKALLEKHNYPQGGQWTPKVVELLLELGDRLQNREFIIEKVSELASSKLRSRHLHAILSHAQNSTVSLAPKQRTIAEAIGQITINPPPPTEKKGGETTVERNFVDTYYEYREKQERYRELFANSHPLVKKWNKATELWRKCHFSSKNSYPELVKHWDSFFVAQQEWRLQRDIFAEEIEALTDPNQLGTDTSIVEAKAWHNKYHNLIVPKEIVDLWRTEFKNPARKAWIADRVKVLLEEASWIFETFETMKSSKTLLERKNSLNALFKNKEDSRKSLSWKDEEDLSSHERRARVLALRAFEDKFSQKLANFFSSEDDENVLTRELIRLDFLNGKMNKSKSLNQRRVFLHDYASSWRAMKKAREAIVLKEVNSGLDLTGTLEQLHDYQVDEFARALVEWLKTNMVKNHKSYKDLRSFNMKFVTGGHKQVMIDFTEGTQGRITSGAAVIDAVLKRHFSKSGFLESTVAWKCDRTNLADKDDDRVWEAVAKIARQERMIPIANNGSRMLIRMYGDDKRLSAASEFLDAMFENFSQVGAYGLSIIAAGTTSCIGGDHDTPINSRWDEDGRDCKVIAYDSKAVDWLPGVDGSGLNNMKIKAQHRLFSIEKLEEELLGFFGKGLTASARITILKDGTLWSVKDTINLQELSSEEFFDRFGLEDNEANRESVALAQGHYSISPQVNHLQKMQKRSRTWDEWFESNKDLPYIFGIEAGKLKGRGKTHLAKMMPELQGKEYLVEVDGESVVQQTDSESNVKTLLKAHGGWFEISTDVYGWSIIDCPKNSSTSLNYQPMSMLIYTEQTLQALQEAYQEKTDSMVDKFSGEALRDRDPEKYTKLMALLRKVVGHKEAEKLGKWATCLLKNPLNGLARWATNFDRTKQKTLRLLMTDHGEYRFTGLTIVDDSHIRRGNVRQLKRAAHWRGPLLVESALQANWCISGELAAQLLDAWQAKQQSKKIDIDLDKQLETIIKRLAFKRGDTESTIEKLLAGILRCIIDDASLVDLGEELVIMDVTDVENMQGDDDGDTVVLDFDEKIVQLFADTEIFWDKFKKANGFRTLQIEMDKKLQIDFALANSIYNGKAYDELCDQGKSLIDTFGIEVPEIAKHYGLNDKIPSPLGLNFKLADQIEKQTKGGFFKHLAKFAFKTGSAPIGPIGAFSNVGPDLAIRALNEMDPKTYKLSEYGRRLWQAYATIASGVQVSIDWAKRVYDIINLFYYDQKRDDGSWAINFEGIHQKT